jgi:hypothetical protein
MLQQMVPGYQPDQHIVDWVYLEQQSVVEQGMSGS